MKIDTLILGNLDTNCYVVTFDKDAIIIDPAANAGKIIDFVKDLNVKEILVTHHHFDHVGALEELEKHFNLKHNDFDNKKFNYEVIKTPGHTDDLVTFYFKKEKVMFCGDFIFKGSIGRFDFPESNRIDMICSLNEICEYPDGITLYPGHGPSTNLGIEKKNFKSFM